VFDSSFCPSVSLKFFGVMKGMDRKRHKNRKIPAFHLVSLVSTFPAPAPKSASVVPPPKAVPSPASFLGSCTSTNRTKNRELRNSITVKKGLRNSNKEARLSIKASMIISVASAVDYVRKSARFKAGSANQCSIYIRLA